MITESFVKIKDINVYYREFGSGFPLLLVHGMGSSLVWDYVIEPLSEYAKIIAIDLPGFGKSDKPKNNYSIKFYSEIIKEFIHALYLDKVNIAGLSLGGMIAAEYAAKNQNTTNKLVLIASAGIKPVAGYIRSPWIYPFAKLILKTFVFSNPQALRKFQEGSYHDKNNIPDLVFEKFYQFMSLPGSKDAYLSALKSVTKLDSGFINDLSLILCETLIVWGENDPTFTIDDGREFNRLIKNSKLEIIPQCGHTVPVEKSREFCDLIIKFISK